MKAYTGVYAYAFMSYSHKDEARIEPLVEKLQASGCNIWYDEGIIAADEWAETIAKKLAGASLFFLILSKNSANSQNVKREIYYAVSHNLPILTLYIEDVELSHGLAMQLGISQSVRLKNDLKNDVEAIKAAFPASLLVEAGREPAVFYRTCNYLYGFAELGLNEYSIIRINRETRERTTLFRHQDSSAFFATHKCDSVHFSPRDEFNSEGVDTLFFSVHSDLDSEIGQSAPNLYVQVDFAIPNPDSESVELKAISGRQKSKEAPLSEIMVFGEKNLAYWARDIK